MDVSGVDVDYLSNDEIFNLCSDIVDTNDVENFVLDGVDVNNLSDDKVQEIYNNLIYNNQNSGTADRVIHLSDQQILDLNYNTADMNADEISLISGQYVYIDNLSDDEVLALYNDTLDTNESFLIAGSTTQCSGTSYVDYAYCGTAGCTSFNIYCYFSELDEGGVGYSANYVSNTYGQDFIRVFSDTINKKGYCTFGNVRSYNNKKLINQFTAYCYSDTYNEGKTVYFSQYK